MSCKSAYLQPVYYYENITIPTIPGTNTPSDDYVVNVKKYGAVGDGITNDTAALDKALLACSTLKLPLYIPPSFVCKYLSTNDFTIPQTGVRGGGKITGTRCRIFETKEVLIDDFACDDFLISGTWHTEIRKLVCKDLTINGSSADWGTYWNKFGSIKCDDLLFDCNHGSINQNEFHNVKITGDKAGHLGGVRITGGVPNVFSECHNNVFFNIDSSQKGNGDNVVIINESLLNQSNTLHNVYCEGGSPFIVGNWNLVGANIDHNGNALKIGHNNYSMLAGTTTGRNSGDFLPISDHNLALGGQWDVLDPTLSHPFCMEFSGVLSTSVVPHNPITCPSGINRQISKEIFGQAGSGYQYLQLNFDFAAPQKVHIAMWYQGDNFIAANSDAEAYTEPTGVYIDPSGWKLLRITMASVTTYARFWLTLDPLASKKITINSVFATIAKAVSLPTPLPFRTYVQTIINGTTFVYDRVTTDEDGAPMNDSKVDGNIYKKSGWGQYYKKSGAAITPTLQKITDAGSVTTNGITVDNVKMPTPIVPNLALRARNQFSFARNEDTNPGSAYPSLYTSLTTLNDLRIFASYTVARGFWMQRYSDSTVAPDGDGWQHPERLITQYAMTGIADIAAVDAIDLDTTIALVNEIKNKLNQLFAAMR